MRNNKGFSLVELLVALAVLAIVMGEIGTLVMNCSTLYQRGSYESSMQSDAQRATSIIEELLVDADKKITCNAGVGPNGSDVLEIERHDGKYDVMLTNMNSKGYGDLVIHSGTMVNTIASYVDCVKFDMAGFNTSDRVTMRLNMYNGYSTYGNNTTGSVTKDFYIRNGLGTSGNKATRSESENDCELEVLRYKEYNLNDIFDNPAAGLDYNFKPASSTALVPAYDLSTVETTGIIKCTDSVNHYFNKGKDETETWVDAYRGSEKAFSIKLYSVPVEIADCSIGTPPSAECKTRDSKFYFFGNSDTATTDTDTYLLVKGISLESEAIGVNTDYSPNGNSSVKLSMKQYYSGAAHNVGGPYQIKDFSSSTQNFTYDNPSVGGQTVRLQGFKYYIDVANNAIVLHTDLFHFDNKSAGSAGLSTYSKSSKENKMYAEVEVNYESDVWLKSTVYLTPTGKPTSAGYELGDDFYTN